MFFSTVNFGRPEGEAAIPIQATLPTQIQAPVVVPQVPKGKKQTIKQKNYVSSKIGVHLA